MSKARHTAKSLSTAIGYSTPIPSSADRIFSRSCSNGNSGEWAPITTSPSSRYFAAHAFTYGSVRSQLMQEKVQNCTTTTLPRRPSGVSGAELSQAVAPPRSGSSPSTGRAAVAVTAVT